MVFFFFLLSITNETERFSEDWWDVSAETSAHSTDAVIILNTTEVSRFMIKRNRIVRVLNEYGRSAVEIIAPGKLRFVQGRVVNRNGTVTRLDNRDDLIRLNIYRFRGDRERATVVLPPGVTNDCIVQLSWGVPVSGGMESWEDTYRMSERWPVREARWSVAGITRRNENMNINWRSPKGQNQFVKKEDGDNLELIFKDLPPEGFQPFSDAIPMYYVLVFSQFYQGTIRPLTYFDDLGDRVLKNATEEKIGPEFKKWAKQVKAQMPKDRAKAVPYLINAMHARIPSIDKMTSEQRGQLDLNTTYKDRLKDSWRRGFADRLDHKIMFFQLAKAVDLPFRLIVPSRREGHLFRPNADPQRVSIVGMAPFEWLFQVDAPSGPMFFDPAEHGITQPYIPVTYQGQTAIRYKVGKKWTAAPVRLPIYPHAYNTRQHIYETRIDAQGHLSHTMTQVNKGRFRGLIYDDYMALTESERQAKLAKNYKTSARGLETDTFALEFTPDSAQVNVSGKTQRDFNDRLTLVPFPGVIAPIERPRRWSEERKKPLLLNPFFQLDSNTIELQPGWTVASDVSWDRKNALGRVAFVVRQESNKVQVQRLMELLQPLAKAEAAKDLKQLLSWIDEAEHQRILLQKTEAP